MLRAFLSAAVVLAECSPLGVIAPSLLCNGLCGHYVTANGKCGGCREWYFKNQFDGYERTCTCCYVRCLSDTDSHEHYMAFNHSSCPTVNVTEEMLSCYKTSSKACRILLPHGRCSNDGLVPVTLREALPTTTVEPALTATAPTSQNGTSASSLPPDKTASPSTSAPKPTSQSTPPISSSSPPSQRDSTVSPKIIDLYPEWIRNLIIILAVVIFVLVVCILVCLYRRNRFRRQTEITLILDNESIPVQVSTIGKKRFAVARIKTKDIPNLEAANRSSAKEPEPDHFRGDETRLLDSGDLENSHEAEIVVSPLGEEEEKEKILRELDCLQTFMKQHKLHKLFYDNGVLFCDFEQKNQVIHVTQDDYFESARNFYRLRLNSYEFKSGKNDSVSYLPYAKLTLLAETLDVQRLTQDYRSLADQFGWSKARIDHLGVQSEKRHGSPTLQLILQSGENVDKLIYSLKNIGHEHLANELRAHVEKVEEHWCKVKSVWEKYCKERKIKHDCSQNDSNDLVLFEPFAQLQALAKGMDDFEEVPEACFEKWMSDLKMASLVDRELLGTRSSCTRGISPTFGLIIKVLEFDHTFSMKSLIDSLKKLSEEYKEAPLFKHYVFPTGNVTAHFNGNQPSF